MTSILFVCLGNICRSPTAEGVMRSLSEARGLGLHLDSAGTGGWHAGEAPDRRAIACAARRGVDLSGLRARQVRESDFQDFDLILGMDRANRRDLMALKPKTCRAHVDSFLHHALSRDADVPDPYYGGPADFEQVYDQCLQAAEDLIRRLAAGA